MRNIYQVAKENLGRHLSLNQTVPEEEGCAEAVSWILLNAGHSIPHGGLQSVNALIMWMKENGFVETHQATPGAVITAHNPNRNNPNYAHTGICMQYGIASNTSATGLFKENYTYKGWEAAFGTHGSISRYFVPNKWG